MNGGALIRVIPKTMFDFGYVPPSTSDSVIVAKALNVIPYNFAYLWVRVYQLRLGSGTSAEVVVTGAHPSNETQQSFLLGTSTSLALAGTPPLLLNTSLTASVPLPPYLQIEVKGTQPNPAVNIGVEISIDVLVRCCG